MGCSSSSELAGEPECPRDFHNHYELLSTVLGSGAFGQVRAARSRSSSGSEELAVKVIDVRLRDKLGGCTGEVDRKRMRLARNEAHLWNELGRHPHCVDLVDVFFERKQSVFHMVMEKCQHPLMQGLADAVVTEGDLGRVFREMLLGVSHVHKMGLVHRDIKPDNFLFGGPDGLTVKLCDFGFATRAPKVGLLKGVYGTVPYMSPEMLSGIGYDQRTDIWSLGATVHVVLYHRHPYAPLENLELMKKAIVLNEPALTFPRTWKQHGNVVRLPEAAVDFVASLLQRPMATRCTAPEALTHSFLRTAPDADTPVASLSLAGYRPVCLLGAVVAKSSVEDHPQTATAMLLRKQQAHAGLQAPLCLLEAEVEEQAFRSVASDSTRAPSVWMSDRPDFSASPASMAQSPVSPTTLQL